MPNPEIPKCCIPLPRRSTVVDISLIRRLVRFRVPGVRDASLDSKSLSPRDPGSRNAEMPKCSSKGSFAFHDFGLLMWSALLLVNRNAEMMIPEMLTNILLRFLISGFPPPCVPITCPQDLRNPNSEVLKFRPRHSSPLYTQKLFSRFGDLINQRFLPHFGLMTPEMPK
jgi:hypothetical protein